MLILALITFHAKILRNVILYVGKISSFCDVSQDIRLTEGGAAFEGCSLSRQF